MEKEVTKLWNFQPEKNRHLTAQVIQSMIPAQVMLLTSSSPLFRTKVAVILSVVTVSASLYFLHSKCTQQAYKTLLFTLAVQSLCVLVSMQRSSQPQMFMELSAIAQTWASFVPIIESANISMGDTTVPIIPSIEELDDVETGLFTVKKIHGEDTNMGMCIVEWDDGEVTWEKTTSVSGTDAYKAIHTTEKRESEKAELEDGKHETVNSSVVKETSSPEEES